MMGRNNYSSGKIKARQGESHSKKRIMVHETPLGKLIWSFWFQTPQRTRVSPLRVHRTYLGQDTLLDENIV